MFVSTSYFICLWQSTFHEWVEKHSLQEAIFNFEFYSILTPWFWWNKISAQKIVQSLVYHCINWLLQHQKCHFILLTLFYLIQNTSMYLKKSSGGACPWPVTWSFSSWLVALAIMSMPFLFHIFLFSTKCHCQPLSQKLFLPLDWSPCSWHEHQM